MMNLNVFFNYLANDAGRNFKIEQLKANANDATLKEVVRLALDPFTQFYQRKIPTYTPNTTAHAASLGSMLPALSDVPGPIGTLVLTIGLLLFRIALVLPAAVPPAESKSS
jgi:hypothetical protein